MQRIFIGCNFYKVYEQKEHKYLNLKRIHGTKLKTLTYNKYLKNLTICL